MNNQIKPEHVNYQFNPELSFVRPDWPGNPVINGRFYNDAVVEPPVFWELWRWKFSRNPQGKEKKREKYSVPVLPSIPDLQGGDKLIWLGHSAFFIRLGGVNFLTDPCLYKISLIKRHVQTPFDPDLLRGIDYLLISHDHRDHIQLEAIEFLAKNNPNMQMLAPLNASRIFRSRLNSGVIRKMHIQEAGWYQHYKTRPDIEVIFFPAKHWGRRFLTDYNKTLWGSFFIRAKEKTLFFGGDTAYSEIFKDIHKITGDIDTCLLPISAYAPDYIMARSHATPEEAVTIFDMLGGRRFIPTHYGTYDLSNEPLGEPIRRLKACFSEQNKMETLVSPAVGEVVPL